MNEHDFNPRLLVTDLEMSVLNTKEALLDSIKRQAGYMHGPNVRMEIWYNKPTERLNWHWFGAHLPEPAVPNTGNWDFNFDPPAYSTDKDAYLVCRFTTQEAKR
jgi:hypothetical protein